MRRRAVLKRGAAIGALGGPLLGGCLQSTAIDGDLRDRTRWRSDVTGWITDVADGRAFGVRGPDGGVFALDAATGDLRWTYGSTSGYSGYSRLTVADAIYFGLSDDAGGSGYGETYAIEFDGTERWTRETGSVYRRPRIDDGVVYVGSDDGVVRAIDAADGDERWHEGVESSAFGPRVEHVSDVVYVVRTVTGARESTLLALDPAVGSERWRYRTSGIDDVTAVGDVAYVIGDDGTAAVSHGEALWAAKGATDGGFGEILGVESGRVVVSRDDALRGFDTATGTEHWRLTTDGSAITAVHDGTAYVGTGELSALDVATGAERWTAAVDGTVESVAVVDEGVDGADHAVFVATVDDRLYRVTPDGATAWSAPIDGDRYRVSAAGDLLFVSTNESVYALVP